MSDYVTIDGESTLDFNAILLDDVIAGAVRDYDVVKVPGRNGDLHIDKGRFLNRNRTITLYFPNGKEDIEAFDSYLQSESALYGYLRIESTLNPDVYMMGQYVGGLRPKKTARYEAARAEFVFDCKPQLFLIDGDEDIVLTSSQAITNPSAYPSKPIIRVVGYGSAFAGTVTIGDSTITIDTEQQSVTIDCETGDCYNGATNCNADVTFSDSKIPTIPPFYSSISLSGVNNVIITPRWYTI